MEYAFCPAPFNVRQWHTTDMQENICLPDNVDKHPMATLHQQRMEKPMQMLQVGPLERCTDKLQKARRQIAGNTHVKQCATYT